MSKAVPSERLIHNGVGAGGQIHGHNIVAFEQPHQYPVVQRIRGNVPWFFAEYLPEIGTVAG